MALPQLLAFKPPDLANTAWALATVDYKPPPSFMADLLSACRQQLYGFSPQVTRTQTPRD